MKTLILSLCLLSFVLAGCGSAPTRPEKYLFTVETNSVPVATNWITATATTNPASGAVEVKNTVNWQTNIESHVVYTVSTNSAAIVETTKRVTNLFAPGFGELAGALLLGILGAWAKLRSTINKGKAGNIALAQGIETLLAIIETTPQGAILADKLKLELAKGQGAAGVLKEIAVIVETYVDNDSAKKAAKLILDSLPAEAGA